VIPFQEARDRVVRSCPPLPPVTVPLAQALGRVLVDAVVAAENVPPFANTAMDGYAVRAADVAGATPDDPARLAVIGTLAAGAAPEREVGAGQALRIMTGAPFPPGADAIVIVEVTETDGDDVLVRAPAAPGEHIRHPGEDLPAGTEVFGPGVVLSPGHLGVLASAGLSEVRVGRRPRVGVLSTGDELVESGSLRPGQIRDSNRTTLLALATRDGFEAVDLGIARDDEAAIRAALARGVERCDALLTSGGVSMGDFDYVKKVLNELGAMSWMQVAIRPAKPLAFGVLGATPIFGLPGNPVSSTVSYELFARPALRRMSGHPDGDLDRARIRGIADEDFRRRSDGRVNYLRVHSAFADDGRCHVRSAGGQGSHQLRAMALADALAVVPDGPGVRRGDELEVIRFGVD
jgi:molybdopterin molybdotransferase